MILKVTYLSMEAEAPELSAPWRWSLLLAVIFLNICLPNLVLSYGIYLVHLSILDVPTWLGLSTPTLLILTYSFTQCWFRDAADSWGGQNGYRVMAALGLIILVSGLIACAFVPYIWQPYIYGIFGGVGSSLISAQVDAVVFETYDSKLQLVRGLCFMGQAMGQFFFPHIIWAIIDNYGYSPSNIVLAGIMLQSLPAILLLKVDDSIVRPVSFSRYSDLSKTYAVFSNETNNGFYSAELQLHDLNKKSWHSPSDENFHRDQNDERDDEPMETITPPPSPEEKRRNIFGVEILPEIPEESENSDDNEEHDVTDLGVHNNKKSISIVIKRLSTLGDNFDDFIIKQVRSDSQTSNISTNKEYSEVEVTYDNISPVTDIQREKVFNSFSFRCQSAYASMKRRMWMPSYRVYRLKRRLLFMMYNINDTFIKPLTRSLSCWRFYPALILSLAKLLITAVTLVLIPMIATQMHPKISMFESNFLMSLHAFTWICFLLSLPWMIQTPKRNFKYVTVLGLLIASAANFILSRASDHDSFSIGCVVAGFGYGAVSSCWETAAQDFVGARKWPKLHSTMETLSAVLLTGFVVGLSFIVDKEGGLQLSIFILFITLAVITSVWLILAAVHLYVSKVRSIRLGRRCLF